MTELPANGTGTRVPTATELEVTATAVANRASELVRASLGRATKAGTKSSQTDVVTETDLAAEQLIRAEIDRLCPDSSIIGEEFGDSSGSGDVSWIVDPIDGTVNFLYGLPVLSVSIAAALDGTVVAGAVVDVVRQETFSAAIGHGATLDGSPIGVCPESDLAKSMVLTGFSYDPVLRSQQAEVLAAVLPAARDIRCFGSAALNLCWVACGRAEAYFERDLKLYDHAAGALIAAEAGADVDQPAQTGELLIATSPGISAALRAVVTRAD